MDQEGQDSVGQGTMLVPEALVNSVKGIGPFRLKPPKFGGPGYGKSVISRVFRRPFSAILNQGFSPGSIPNVPGS